MAPFRLVQLPSIASTAELLVLALPETTLWVTRGFPESSVGHMRDAHASESLPGSRFDPDFVDSMGGIEGIVADAARRRPPRQEGVTEVIYDYPIGGDALISVSELQSLLGDVGILEARGLLQRDPRRAGLRILVRDAADVLGLRPTRRLQLIVGTVPPALAVAVAQGSGHTGSSATPPWLVRTMFPGRIAPRTPADPNLKGRSPDDPELLESRAFWADHVLLDTSVLRR